MTGAGLLHDLVTWFARDGDARDVELPGERVDPPSKSLVVSGTLLALGGSFADPTLLVADA